MRNALFREISLSCLGVKIYAGQRLGREDRIKGGWLFLCIGKLDFFSYKEKRGRGTKLLDRSLDFPDFYQVCHLKKGSVKLGFIYGYVWKSRKELSFCMSKYRA